MEGWTTPGVCSPTMPTRKNPVDVFKRYFYGTNKAHQYCDLILPPKIEPPTSGYPVAVFVHGGFWKNHWYADLSLAMADDLAYHGFACWIMEYRRVKDQGGGFPGTLEDVAGALHLLSAAHEESSSSMGKKILDLDRVVLIGHSAGGQLALIVSQVQKWRLPVSSLVKIKPCAVVCQAGVTELVQAAHDKLSDEGTAVQNFMGGQPEDLVEHYSIANPLSYFPYSCQLLMVHGAKDTDVPPKYSNIFKEVAERHGHKVELCMLEDADHYAVINPNHSTWTLQRKAILALVEQASGGGGSAADPSSPKL